MHSGSDGGVIHTLSVGIPQSNGRLATHTLRYFFEFAVRSLTHFIVVCLESTFDFRVPAARMRQIVFALERVDRKHKFFRTWRYKRRNAVQRPDKICRSKTGIGKFIGLSAVFKLDYEPLHRRHRWARYDSNFARWYRSIHVQPQDSGNAFQGTGFNHGDGAWLAFDVIAGLNDNAQSSRQLHLRQKLCHSEYDCKMGIMSTSMHHAWVSGSKNRSVQLSDGQRIHVATNRYRLLSLSKISH